MLEISLRMTYKLLFKLFICFSIVLYVQCEEYDVQCYYSRGQDLIRLSPCVRAVFTAPVFDINGKLLDIQGDYCKAHYDTRYHYPDYIGIAKRGQCTFEQKSRVAASLGLKGLIIINHDETAFPVSSGDTRYQSKIPVVMIGNNSIDLPDGLDDLASIRVTLKCDESVKQQLLSQQKNADNIRTLIIEDLFQGGGLTLCWLGAGIIMITSYYLGYYFYNSASIPNHIPNDTNTIAASNTTRKDKRQKHPQQFLLQPLLWLTLYLIMTFAYLLTHLATLRPIAFSISITSSPSTLYPLLQPYNHRETDELIFAALLRYTAQNLSDYSLYNKPILQQLQLAQENYNHPLFLHPPFFTYSSLAMLTASERLFSHFSSGSTATSTAIDGDLFALPLPCIPLIYQLLTMYCLPLICSELFSSIAVAAISPSSCITSSTVSSSLNVFSISMKAMFLFIICPITGFISQKYWIDNALLLTITLAVYLHLLFTRLGLATSRLEGEESVVEGERRVPRSWQWSMVMQFLSGLLGFGGLAMNTKITALALLPFLCIWTCLQHVERYYTYHIVHCKILFNKSSSSSIFGNYTVYLISAFLLFLDLFAFFLGTSFAYAPWCYWYHARTGRWLPSAWPSPEMIAKFPFIKHIENKPYHTYFSTLLQIAPLHCVGMVLVVMVGIGAMGRYLWTSPPKQKQRPDEKIDERRTTDEDTPQGSTLKQHESSIVEQEKEEQFQVQQIELNSHVKLFLGLRVGSLLLVPSAFLGGLSLVGILGGGYQMRFLAPIIPATTILTAIAWESFQVLGRQFACSHNAATSLCALCEGILCLMILYTICLFFYYTVLYGPLFAEVEYGLVDILTTILRSPYQSAGSNEVMMEVIAFVKHFGFMRR